MFHGIMYIYMGQTIPNVWHNPTTICVRPLALLAIMVILRILEKYEEEKQCKSFELVILAGTMVLCNLAKPSFSQIIIPGLAFYLLYLLIKTKFTAVPFCLKVAVAFVPSVILLFGQMYVSFVTSNSADGGIEIAWFEVMSYRSPNIAISMILSYFFPIYVLVTNISIFRKRDIRLIFFVWLSGFLEAAMLAETGDRRYHGNFGWGSLLSAFFVYLVSLKSFIEINQSYNENSIKQRVSVGIGWLILFLQIIIGIYYILILITTENWA